MGWRYLNRRVEPAVISYIASVAVKLSPLMQTTSGHLIRARERDDNADAWRRWISTASPSEDRGTGREDARRLYERRPCVP